MPSKARPETHRRLLAAYRKTRPTYARLASSLAKRIERICDEIGLYPIVQARAKSLDSLLAKLERTRPGGSGSLAAVSDLCGVRVILHTRDEVERLRARLRQEFLLTPIPETRARRDLGAHAYVSPRFRLQLRSSDGQARSSPAAELQLRTLAEHTWADVYHELGYRNDFRLPGRWRREFDHAAGLLRDCDRRFRQVSAAITTYEGSLDAYMSVDQLAALRRRIDLLLTLGPPDAGLIHRLIRVHLAQDDLAPLPALLKRYRRLVHGRAGALRDLGVAYCRMHAPRSARFRRGVAMLRRAIQLDPHDIDALCSLGGALRRAGERDASAKRYREAYRLDPTHPYALGNHLAEELLRRRDVALLTLHRATVQESIERCARQIEARINLPWALFDLGVFHLYLGDSQEALRFYARGIALAPHPWMIASAAKPIRALLAARIPLDGLVTVERLLALAWWTRAASPDRRRALPPWTQALSKGTALRAPLCVVIRNASVRSGEMLGSALESALRGVRGSLVLASVDATLPSAEAAIKAARLSSMQLIPYGDPRDASPVAPGTLGQCMGFWQDVLASDRSPSRVGVIVFDSHPTVSSELAISLALGARVALVGAAADGLWAQPLWRDGWGDAADGRSRGAPLQAVLDTPRALKAFIDSLR